MQEMRKLLLLVLLPFVGYAQTKTTAEKEANRKLDSMITKVSMQVKQATDTVKKRNEVLKKK